jgi:hypothetical protein
MGRMRMLNGFDRLRHDAVGRDRSTTTSATLAPRARIAAIRVTRGVQEGHHATRRLHVIGAHVLGDAPARSPPLCAADNPERHLAVIDVTHHRHHGGAGLRSLHGAVLQVSFDLVFLEGRGAMAQLLDHQ